MLKDITIGQYFPGTSPIHKLDPRMKIVLTVAYIILLFTAQNAVGLAVGVLFLVLVYGISKIPPVMILRSLKPVVPIIVFTSVLNMFFIDGRVLFQWWILKLTAEGVKTAVFMSVRIVCLIAGTSLLTYTTSPIALTDGIERLCNPLKRFKLPVHELAMMMTIALRFIPTLIEETDKIMSAQKARGADLERRAHAAGARAHPDFDPALRVGVPPRGRAGARDGVPLLPRRRRPYPHEAAQDPPARRVERRLRGGLPGLHRPFQSLRGPGFGAAGPAASFCLAGR